MSDVMTETEAAEYLRRSRKTLQRRRANKQIAYIEDEGRIFYRKSDFEDYLQKRRIIATAPPPAPRPSRYRISPKVAEKNRQAIIDII